MTTWVNFIAAGITGHGNFAALLNGGGRHNDYSIEHNRYGATIRAAPSRVRRATMEDFLSSGTFHIAQPARPSIPATQRRTHGSENNPIELSDDENTSARGSSSSSGSGLQTRSTTTGSSSSSAVVDLIDLTDDAEYVPSSSSSRAAFPAPSGFGLQSAVHFPIRAHTSPPLHPTSAMSSFGNYNLMDFLSDEEDDEDYEPPIELDEDLERDDSSELSEEEEEEDSAQNEVIELPDSDDEENLQATMTIPARNPANARLSGIMVWCHECDSYHDKQRVYDDVSYCPSTYASLVSTNGFSDIQQDRIEASSSSAGNSALKNDVPSVASDLPPPQILSAYSVRAVKLSSDHEDDAEWTSDDGTTSAQWQSRGSHMSAARSTSHSALPAEEAVEAESDLSRTMSDATTASSRSRASLAVVQAQVHMEDSGDGDDRTQCSENEEEEKCLKVQKSSIITQSTTSRNTKRANWLAYMEEEEELAEAECLTKRVRQSIDEGDNEGI